MPPSFKALASITVWILFILGWIGVLEAIAGAVGIITGLYLASLEMTVAAFGVGVVSLILSVCAMKLRQMLE